MRSAYFILAVLTFCAVHFINCDEGNNTVQESNTEVVPVNLEDILSSNGSSPEGRLFFNFNPCGTLPTLLGIGDGKCSISCFVQGGQQQGGYCDNGVCFCNQIA